MGNNMNIMLSNMIIMLHSMNIMLCGMIKTEKNYNIYFPAKKRAEQWTYTNLKIGKILETTYSY
jgi:hypothetical protein